MPTTAVTARDNLIVGLIGWNAGTVGPIEQSYEGHWGARVAVTLLVYQIGAGGCREHGDARARCGTRADGWILDVKM